MTRSAIWIQLQLLLLITLIQCYQSYTSRKITPQTISPFLPMEPIENVFQPDLLPKHVAFIVDGNGRWGLEHHHERMAGHRFGAEKSVEIINATFSAGVECITLFLFSTENWKRPVHEVTNIFELLNEYLRKYSTFFKEKKIELHTIGQIKHLSPITQTLLRTTGYHPSTNPQSNHNHEVVSSTSSKKLILALNYGGRDEIVTACQEIAEQVQSKKIQINDITEKVFYQHTFTGKLNISDPDLIIRTSGETRLSNFLLWQSAYSEIEYINTLCKL
jgi:undecaprenyl diphosphate synthase